MAVERGHVEKTCFLVSGAGTIDCSYGKIKLPHIILKISSCNM